MIIDQVVRGDGTMVEIQAALGPKEEFRAFFSQFKDIRMLLLFPMFFSSNYCESFLVSRIGEIYLAVGGND